jgi:hypothetical protein
LHPMQHQLLLLQPQRYAYLLQSQPFHLPLNLYI